MLIHLICLMSHNTQHLLQCSVTFYVFVKEALNYEQATYHTHMCISIYVCTYIQNDAKLHNSGALWTGMCLQSLPVMCYICPILYIVVVYVSKSFLLYITCRHSHVCWLHWLKMSESTKLYWKELCSDTPMKEIAQDLALVFIWLREYFDIGDS